MTIDERNSNASDRAPQGAPGDGNCPPRELFTTNRHKHVETEEGHMVITGVTGSEKLQRCEDEPIHIPGAVQGFGCLIAFKVVGDLGGLGDDSESDLPRLDIRIVSEVGRHSMYHV